MHTELLKKIDAMIESREEDLIHDIERLVNIDSSQGTPLPGAPFGAGPKKVLDTVMELGAQEGFCVTDYHVGVVSLSLYSGQPDLGIWAHGDVVPAGDGWDFPPFTATRHKGCLIGRGVTDNKGQLAATFHLLKIFKELGIKLNYNPALYVGSNEESGMHDMKGVEGNPDAKGFIHVCTPPKLSLVPDGNFPAGYGAKGMTSFFLRKETPLHGLTLTAGLDETPGLATATLAAQKELTAYSEPRHTSNPDPNGNMITMLMSQLLEENLVQEDDRDALSFIRDISRSIHGDVFGINVPTELMTPTIVYAKTIRSFDGCPELEIRVRYPIELTYDEVAAKISAVCGEHGFTVHSERGHEPYLLDKDAEVFKTLVQVANQVVGEERQPYVNGSTYAHYLPNAYIFGMEGCCPPEDFPAGHGMPHGVDECVSVFRLKRAMKIYARALLALDDLQW